MPKAAIADTEAAGELGRVVNALTTAKEFREAGDDVKIVFDGAGTKWIGELSKPDHKYHPLFAAVKESTQGACACCAEAYGAKEGVEQAGIRLLDEYEQHPSLRSLSVEGYQVITF